MFDLVLFSLRRQTSPISFASRGSKGNRRRLHAGYYYSVYSAMILKTKHNTHSKNFTHMLHLFPMVKNEGKKRQINLRQYTQARRRGGGGVRGVRTDPLWSSIMED